MPYIRDQKNVHRMHTAVRLNELIQQNSKAAKLVVMNLPPPPKTSDGLTRELQCILFSMIFMYSSPLSVTLKSNPIIHKEKQTQIYIGSKSKKSNLIV